jgi:hypothetical protein
MEHLLPEQAVVRGIVTTPWVQQQSRCSALGALFFFFFKSSQVLVGLFLFRFIYKLLLITSQIGSIMPEHFFPAREKLAGIFIIVLLYCVARIKPPVTKRQRKLSHHHIIIIFGWCVPIRAGLWTCLRGRPPPPSESEIFFSRVGQ